MPKDLTQPLKFYNFENGSCPYAARTWIAMAELGLPFELVPVSPYPKPDWYVKGFYIRSLTNIPC